MDGKTSALESLRRAGLVLIKIRTEALRRELHTELKLCVVDHREEIFNPIYEYDDEHLMPVSRESKEMLSPSMVKETRQWVEDLCLQDNPPYGKVVKILLSKFAH